MTFTTDTSGDTKRKVEHTFFWLIMVPILLIIFATGFFPFMIQSLLYEGAWIMLLILGPFTVLPILNIILLIYHIGWSQKFITGKVRTTVALVTAVLFLISMTGTIFLGTNYHVSGGQPTDIGQIIAIIFLTVFPISTLLLCVVLIPQSMPLVTCLSRKEKISTIAAFLILTFSAYFAIPARIQFLYYAPQFEELLETPPQTNRGESYEIGPYSGVFVIDSQGNKIYTFGELKPFQIGQNYYGIAYLSAPEKSIGSPAIYGLVGENLKYKIYKNWYFYALLNEPFG